MSASIFKNTDISPEEAEIFNHSQFRHYIYEETHYGVNYAQSLQTFTFLFNDFIPYRQFNYLHQHWNVDIINEDENIRRTRRTYFLFDYKNEFNDKHKNSKYMMFIEHELPENITLSSLTRAFEKHKSLGLNSQFIVISSVYNNIVFERDNDGKYTLIHNSTQYADEGFKDSEIIDFLEGKLAKDDIIMKRNVEPARGVIKINNDTSEIDKDRYYAIKSLKFIFDKFRLSYFSWIKERDIEFNRPLRK